MCRRQTDTLHVARVWCAIEHVREGRQVANRDRISRYLLREHDILEKETASLLRFASKERLVLRYRSVTRKGDNAGSEQDGYRIPDVEADFVCTSLVALILCGNL